MNKFFKNNYNLRRSLYTLGIIIIAIIFYRLTENMQFNNGFSTLLSVLSPFIIGVVMAYILNCITNFIERKLLIKFKVFKSDTPKIKRHKRRISILSSFIVLIGIVVAIVAYLIPEIITSIENLVQFIVKMDYTTIHISVNRFLFKYNIHISPEIVNSVLHSFTGFFENIADSLEYVPTMVSSVVLYFIDIASSFVNVVLGIMISVYILADKENIVLLGKKTIRAFFSDNICRKLTLYVKELNQAFNQFFFGKLVDSCIIGLLFYIVALIFDFPYPTLCALIIGITNMIPYFGPFIGAIPVVALTFLVEPITAIGVLIAIVILQQFDGIILGPKILGESINLSPIGVIFAITIGGALAGPLGMFFGVPIFSVICKFALIGIDSLIAKKAAQNEERITKDE